LRRSEALTVPVRTDCREAQDIVPVGRDQLFVDAPGGWQHINLTGDYLWDADIGIAPDGFRALRRTATSLHPAVAA
jgi:hypothetical protein